MPAGGVVTIGSSRPSWTGVGGSSGSASGSGAGTTGSRATWRERRPRTALRRSSYGSGPGGGSGLGSGLLGSGLLGDRRGFAPSEPPALRTEEGREPKLKSLACKGAFVPTALGCDWPVSDSASSCACSRASFSSLPSLPGREAGCNSCPESAAAGTAREYRRLRISGLCRERLAFVGEAKEGRLRLGSRDGGIGTEMPVVSVGSAVPDGVALVVVVVSWAAETLGDILLLFGADSSIISSPEHHLFVEIMTSGRVAVRSWTKLVRGVSQAWRGSRRVEMRQTACRIRRQFKQQATAQPW